ncbi:MAG: carbohydrate binding domain-containing protein [Chitinophagaceae bacterium]|nr:carbohydrate binding domain-containing protein [Chitinophagaceae bacterium]
MVRYSAWSLLLLLLFVTGVPGVAQKTGSRKFSTYSKQISADLFGIFFEDISYAADGGLYAELVQNRSFEYSATDRKEWHPFTAWEYMTKGYGYGSISVETESPLHANNPHYAVLTIEDPGQEGIGLVNYGFDGIVLKAGEQYNFSIFAKKLSEQPVSLSIQLRNKKGAIFSEAVLDVNGRQWQKYTTSLTATENYDTATIAVISRSKGKVAMDMISLFPQKTFKGRTNGLRADLAQAIADLKPKFMRFPGGCLVHGDGLGNMYRWKNTIGPIEQRTAQKNIWNYHQTAGLGYYEYFQFCEDIGAKPLPVVPAAVSCQNSGGTWRIGGTGQKGLPMNEMQEYIQEVLDLIEYANGSVTSEWGAKRAEAGHPEPFHLEYVGVGNEDKITPEFSERFQLIYNAVKAKYPGIIVIGTVGPAPEGEDFDLGWKLANELNIPVVDEHYYQPPQWFLNNHFRYDSYDRTKSKVYLGEYASRGNTLFNALAEAAYMISLERNGDVVHMASYAPLLANQSHTSWNPNLVYFTNTSVTPTVNYYVQQLFSLNQGDIYYSGIVSFGDRSGVKDSNLAASCVKDKKTGNVIIKIVNAGSVTVNAELNISVFGKLSPIAELQVLSGEPGMKNTLQDPVKVIPEISALQVKKKVVYKVPSYSLNIIRIRARK